jgi:hypothetical protein
MKNQNKIKLTDQLLEYLSFRDWQMPFGKEFMRRRENITCIQTFPKSLRTILFFARRILRSKKSIFASQFVDQNSLRISTQLIRYCSGVHLFCVAVWLHFRRCIGPEWK